MRFGRWLYWNVSPKGRLERFDAWMDGERDGILREAVDRVTFTNGTAPHTFKPLGFSDRFKWNGRCHACLIPRRYHYYAENTAWVPARAISDRSASLRYIPGKVDQFGHQVPFGSMRPLYPDDSWA